MLLAEIPSPAIMGILNVTPDSFFDGGAYNSVDKALHRAQTMLADGVDIIDIGAESTRPGATPVSVNEEMHRLLPVIEKLRAESGVKISVDTSTPAVMRQAAKLGANMINDVRALQRHGALDAAAASGLPVCLVHMQGRPTSMQDKPVYTDLMQEITDFFIARTKACIKAGITKDKIILDPGFGFGKTSQHNMMLINRLSMLTKLAYPILVGISRKSTIRKILAPLGSDTLIGSVAGALISVQKGASVVRVHDVKETREALAVYQSITSEELNFIG